MAEEKVIKYQITPTIRIFPEFTGTRVNCRKYCVPLGIAVTIEAPSPANEEEVLKYTKATSMAAFMKKAVMANGHAECGWDSIKADKKSEAELLQGIGADGWGDPKLTKWFEDGFTSKAAPRSDKAVVNAQNKADADAYRAMLDATGGDAEMLAEIIAQAKKKAAQKK